MVSVIASRDDPARLAAAGRVRVGGGLLSLRGRLSLIAALLTFAGLVLTVSITYWSILGLRLSDMDRESRLLAEVILDAVVLRPGGTIRVPPIIETYLTDENGANSAQAYLDGQLAWEGGVLNAPRPLDPAGLLEGRGERSVGGWRVYTARDENAAVIIQVGRPLAGVREILSLYRSIAVPAALLLSLAASVIAWFVVGLALRPLRRLAEAATNFEDGGEIPPVPGHDEPGMLAHSFADLLGRLRGERQREQQFLAYAAHELRTPLSALRAGLEAARFGRVAADAPFIDRLHGEALRLERLAQNLLALSRAEGGEVRFEMLQLDELAAVAYDRFQPLALEKGLELSLENETAQVSGDPRLLGQALDNLLANALRCTRHGTVTIRSGRSAGDGYLEVSDTGPGLPEPLREGLGMRVVRAVARAHLAELKLSGKEGTSARLTLPLDRELPAATRAE
ncbi:MAG: HAMP domain-containing sensor histidine kinase [Trueperaceae bacterium]